ncbi:MAG: hypothetical protein JNJ54_36270, partial [Myxococcaceae bacterium]|nr:hypothetical protein [Myxococcaceae bacterium]
STAGGSTAGGSTAGGSTAGGSTAGGSTAGGSTAGGTAGGSMGGGTAGGSMGGGTGGGMGPLNTYVCVTCPGAADTNPGTQTSPLRTIARGIAVAQQLNLPTVFVGGLQGASTTYAEAITVPNRVVVQGRWIVSMAGTWSRTGNPRTALLNLSPLGVTFAPGATRSSGLDGLRVISSGAVAGSTSVAAITIVDASPLILDVQVDAPSTSLPPPTTAAGIAVSTTNGALTPANPRIAGIGNTTRAQVSAGPATTNSFAISVSASAAELQYLDLRGGNVSGPSTASAGLFLVGAAGTTLSASSAFAGLASNGGCAGVAAGGQTANILLDTIEARGCNNPGGPIAPALESVGVSFGSCPALPPLAAPPRLVDSSVQGGSASGMNSYTVGVLASDGCALDIERNTVTGNGALFSTTVPTSAAGIVCTSEQQRGISGANSACRIASNPSVNAGRAQSASIGLACIGNCATGTAACRGSCTEVVRNQVRGENAPAVFHGIIQHSSPRVARNTFGTDSVQCVGGSGMSTGIYGLRVEGAASRIENNLILGGQCQTAVGFEQVNIVRTGDSSTPAPDVHSNTIVPTTPSGISMNVYIVGVQVRAGGSVSTPFGPLGTYRNNIITALGFASFRAALAELTSDSDPAVLENNNFWSGPSFVMPPTPPLYFNENTTMLNTAAQINALNGGGVTSNNNMSLDPGFAANFRLGTMSPMRAVGTLTGAPQDDIDGDRRPSMGTMVPDVGCDEAP